MAEQPISTRDEQWRLAEFDAVSRWASLPPAVTQTLFGLGWAAVFVLARTLIDGVAPTAGPFAPIYPLVLVSTLFGRLRSGLVTYVACFAWAWFVVLPRAATLALARPSDVTRTAVSALTVLVVLGFAELFRKAVRRAVSQREIAITELRDREAELESLNHSLEEEIADRTRELTRTWQVSPDLLGILDEDGRFVTRNPAWSAVLGWSDEDVRSKRLSDLMHPEDLPAAREAWRRIKGGEPVIRLENRLRRNDGSWRWLAWIIVPEGGRFYCSARDVTAEREQAVELALAQESLRHSQKLEAIGQLTGGVAHDFNNLLTVIRGSVDLLRRSDADPDRRRRYIDAIGDTADRAAKLTGQLLAFARRQALSPETFDCGASVVEIAAMIGTLAGSRIAVTTELPDEQCFVRADRSQFEAAIVNIGVNARDAMNGEGRIHIKVASVAELPAVRSHAPVAGAFVAITIEDSGIGIAPEDLARVFEPFFTTKELGKGAGLGLSQVIGFAKQSGGDVRVDSVQGRGTTFTIYLPRVPHHAVDVAARPAAGSEDIRGGVRVLLVEDNGPVGEFAAQALRELGHETILAGSAEQALERLRADGARFDVVFSDVVMPGMDGLELARRVRSERPDLPIILTSGYSHVLAREGTCGFELLRKPYSLDQLSRAFEKALTERGNVG